MPNMRMALFIVFIINYQFSQGQEKTLISHKNDKFHDAKSIEWNKAYSEDALEHHTFDFVAYDAWLDGFLEDNKPFIISYDVGTLTINGGILPKSLQKKYVDKIESELDYLGVIKEKRKFKLKCQGMYFTTRIIQSDDGVDCRMKSDGIKFVTGYSSNDINMPIMLPGFNQIQDSVLIVELIRDKVIETPKDYKFKCNSKNCWLNDKSIDTILAPKYIQLFKSLRGLQPVDEKDFVSASFNSTDCDRLIKLPK